MAPAAPAKKSSQELPAKEAALFRIVVKCYESKQYKKGLKTADTVLKKFPEHGETLAMKGLTMNCLARKEEAYKLVREGLKHHLTSHVCWHVYGLLYRSDKNYAEAAKCYLNALRQEADNTQILADLAQLQVQLRKHEDFVSTRTKLLKLKPSARGSWVALAVAHHLAGRPGEAAAVVQDFLQAQGDSEPPLAERYEHSELLLYRGELLEESGQPLLALRHLEACAARVRDRPSLQEAQARLHLALGDAPAAEKLYREMLARNPDCLEYHAGLRSALLSSAQLSGDAATALLVAEYEQLQKSYPRSSACKREPLTFLRGEAFETAAAAYIAPFLRKGVPALASDLAALYSRACGALAARSASSDRAAAGAAAAAAVEWRDAALGRVIAAAESSLRERSALPGAADGSEQPGVLPWAQLLLGQHYAATGDAVTGLTHVESAIAHTPTCPDFYLAKAQLLASTGNLLAAAEATEEARGMDLADRYLNSVAIKALLAADQLDRAEAVGALFARAGAGGGAAADGTANLTDMQCQWFTVGVGELHLRAGRLGPALKRFHTVRKHFEDFEEDQFDFHSYCVRKVTLRAYTRLLRLLDSMPGEEYYRTAARGAVTAYLRIFDSRTAPASADADGGAAGGDEDAAAMAALPPNERKKARAKARKVEAAAAEAAAAAAAAAAATAAAAAAQSKGGAEVPARPVDADPQGAALAGTADPLGEATKWVAKLTSHAGGHAISQALACEVYCRKGRLLLALQAARKLAQLGVGLSGEACCSFADAHLATVRVLRDGEKALAQPGAPEPLRLLLNEGLLALRAGAADAKAYNEAVLVRLGAGAAGACEAARGLLAAA